VGRLLQEVSGPSRFRSAAVTRHIDVSNGVMSVKPPIAALVGALVASLLLPGASGFAQDLGRGRGRSIERAPVDVERLVQRANLIVHGVVAKKGPRWIGRVIYTQYEVTVQETLKGAARQTVVVAVPGGSMGNVELKVPGAPSLQPGEQLIFFGEPLAGTASFAPVGTFEGIMPVRPGRGNAPSTVSPYDTPQALPAFLEQVRALNGRR